jgi:hypothetical protein
VGIYPALICPLPVIASERLIFPELTYPSQIKQAALVDIETEPNLTQVSAVYSGKTPLVTPGLVAVEIEGTVKMLEEPLKVNIPPFELE